MSFSLPKLLTWLLAPLSALSGGMIEIRNWYYHEHLLPIAKLPKPTISVGNILVGGSGKTPVVRYLARLLNRKHQTVAILTRGYGRKTKRTVSLTLETVSNAPYPSTGDEPRLLARDLSNGVVVVDANRLQGGKRALQSFNPDVFLLDDAFQHRRIHRDVDIVTLDATNLWGGGFLLPAGKLREPVSQLRRADLLWVTRINQSFSGIDSIKKEIKKKIEKPLIFSEHIVKRVVSLHDYTVLSLQDIKGKRVVAFCGIANPNSFRHTITDVGAAIEAFHSYPDHYPYQKNDLEKLYQSKHANHADYLITTEKDAARIESEMNSKILKDIYFIEIEVNVVSGESTLQNIVEKLNLF